MPKQVVKTEASLLANPAPSKQPPGDDNIDDFIEEDEMDDDDEFVPDTNTDEDEDEDEDDGDDFDEAEDEEEEEEDEAAVATSKDRSKKESAPSWIDTSNIIEGKRQRKPTGKRLIDELYESDDIRKMMLDGVGDEIHEALIDEDFENDTESDTEEEIEESDDETDDEDTDEEKTNKEQARVCKSPKKAKPRAVAKEKEVSNIVGVAPQIVGCEE